MAAAVHYIALGKESTLLALAKADAPNLLARPLSGAEQSLYSASGGEDDIHTIMAHRMCVHYS